MDQVTPQKARLPRKYRNGRLLRGIGTWSELRARYYQQRTITRAGQAPYSPTLLRKLKVPFYKRAFFAVCHKLGFI